MAVCVLPGTELAFATKVSREPRRLFGWKTGTINQTTAIFRQINKDKLHTYHDALEFPDGQIVLLTHLIEGQQATVLQLPAEPATATGSGSVRLSMRRGLSQGDYCGIRFYSANRNCAVEFAMAGTRFFVPST
jgi:hypothetical protein